MSDDELFVLEEPPFLFGWNIHKDIPMMTYATGKLYINDRKKNAISSYTGILGNDNEILLEPEKRIKKQKMMYGIVKSTFADKIPTVKIVPVFLHAGVGFAIPIKQSMI